MCYEDLALHREAAVSKDHGPTTITPVIPCAS